jgi:hypothetical protein
LDSQKTGENGQLATQCCAEWPGFPAAENDTESIEKDTKAEFLGRFVL